MTPDELKRARRVISAGPPPHPSEQTPGPYIVELGKIEQRVIDEEGREATAREMICALAGLLDMQAYSDQFARFESLRRAVERYDRGLLVIQ